MNPLVRAACAALVTLLAAAPAEAARGRDVTFGYEWADSSDGAQAGPAFFDGLPATLTPADDAPPSPVTLPWAFPYYGTDYTQAWVSDNGWISFADPGTDARPAADALPSAAAPPLIVAPLWTDLDCSGSLPGQRIIHGPVNAAGAYRFVFSGTDVATSALVSFELHLYRDGRIKVHYLSGASFATATVGIGNGDGADGFAVVDRGAPAPGVPAPPGADYLIDINRPALLPSECALIPAASCGTISDSLPGTMPQNVSSYACGAASWWGRERVYALTLTSARRLHLGLTTGTGRNLALHLLAACDERSCIAGPATSIDASLAPGTYFVAVDAPTEADEGSFTLQADCPRLGQPVTCGDTLSSDTTGGSSLFFNPPCGAGLAFTGPERIYAIDAAATTNVRAILSGADAALDVLLYRVPATGVIGDADCIQRGDTMVLGGELPAGEYLVVVDGVLGAQGPFTLETSCDVVADCSALAGTIDFTGGNRQLVAGDTTGGASSLSRYGCELDTVYDGPESVYRLVLPRAGQVAIHELGAASGLRWFVLDTCNEGTCYGGTTGSCGFTLGAGEHYLVVDGAAGAAGPFSAELVLDDTFGHWSGCEDAMPPTRPGDAVSTEWHFDDGAFCWSDPSSHNYPDGCTFAMYVAVRCGTAFHIPLFDVESGHVRVFDVFRNQYLNLVATSTSGWTASGDDIAWEDCTGDAPEWNMETTDIFFENPAGLCGVYRLEFPKHAGFEWNLFANCTGDNAGAYAIFDTLCGALNAYEPLPEAHLVSASAVVTCPDISVTYTIANDGCADAAGVEVTLFDGPTPVATDVVPLLAASASATRSFRATFPAGFSTTDVTVQVDAGALLDECGEVAGAGCLPNPGLDVMRVADCAPPSCAVSAAGSATPPAICPGETASIDASASTFANCPTGALEYQLTGPAGTLPWQASPVFPGLAPAASADYALEARCSDPAQQATCTDATVVRVDVTDPAAGTDLLPRVGPTLRLGRPDAYSSVVAPLRWATGRPLDVAAGEHVHVLRSVAPDTGFAQIGLPDPPLLQASSFADTAADPASTGTTLLFYLVAVANACHGDNRADDPSSP